ncbi:MAG: Zn-dependent oxidoreductase, NADPH:quinone reductase [Marmoricola sp.]|nr:Zn-dependent oxidoreductase, NADPH:quinone reductase [Marmoricola sp.]
MHAAVLHTLGRPPRYAKHPDPQLASGQSLVRVTAAPLVPLDLLCASGTSYFGPPAVPYVPGVQGVGVIESSPSLPAGSRVWFAASAGMAPGDGSLAEYAAVAADDLVPVTEPVGDEQLAALGLSAVAAWMSLTWRARLQPGERVLVLGGGGAVGQTAIAAARLLGSSRIVATCRSEDAAARAYAAGADHVVLIVESSDDLAARLDAVCDGAVDVVIDPVFGPSAIAASRVLTDGGRLVNLGGASGDSATFSSATLRGRSIDLLGYTNNSLSVEQRHQAITEISRHAAAGALAVAHDVRPLADVEPVWERLASGDTARCVLQP